jgi:hypothetical protein
MPAGSSRVIKKGPPPIGLQIDALYQLKQELAKHQEVEKTIQARIAEAEAKLMETMEAEGVNKSTGKSATVSISEVVTGNVTDWDAFGAFVIKTKQLHLLQRRVSDPAIREVFEKKGSVPGVQPFTKKRLNVRKVAG